MTSDAAQHGSLWWSTAAIERRPPLVVDATTDVCIVGAGIAGLTAAYMLARKGIKVIVLEAGHIGGGETGRTTAHLTSALDDRFYLLEQLLGEEKARLAAESHSAAIDAIESIIQLEGIDCDFKRLSGYLFIPPGHADEGPNLLEMELKAARRAGLTVQRIAEPPIPGYNVGLSLRFDHQGQFHPLKYMAGLARAVESAGGRICCDTRAVKIRGGADPSVRTAGGAVVHCDAIIVATNSPVNDRVAVHTKQAPYRTYVLGLMVPHGSIEHALYWDGYWKMDDESYHYVRLAEGPRMRADQHGLADPEDPPAFDVLIVGGEDHKTGQPEREGSVEEREAPDAEPKRVDHKMRFARLEEWARMHFPEARDLLWRWSGQVMEPADGMGFIGRNPMDSENVYIATGDSGNGMTHGTIAGFLLTDLIRGEKNPWTDLYSPSRSVGLGGGSAGEYWKENLNVVRKYGEWFRGGEVSSIDEIPPGEGALLRRGLRLVAVHRAQDGSVTELSAVCPHMGCIVHWNNAEESWDCPCHGSRYDAHGNVLSGPAVSNLKVLRPRDGQPPGRREEPQERRQAPAPGGADRPGRAPAPPPAAPGQARHEEISTRQDVIVRHEPRGSAPQSPSSTGRPVPPAPLEE